MVSFLTRHARFPRVLAMLVGASLGCGRELPRAIEQAHLDGAGVWGFADSTQLRVAAVPARVATTVEFTVAGSGRAPGRWRIGARAPRAVSRQDVRRTMQVERPDDPRDRWQTLTADGGPVALELGPDFLAEQVVVVARRLNAAGDVVRATSGPRTERGDAILAVVDREVRPRDLVVARGTPTLDGNLEEPAWSETSWHRLVASRDGEPMARKAEVAMRWDSEAIYFGGRISDRDIWSDFTAHDDPLYKQTAFEVFLSARNDGARYVELQVSPRGIRFDSRFETYRKGELGWNGDWSAAVAVEGTLDQRKDRDRSWAVEVAVPWQTLCQATDIPCSPAAGSTFFANVFVLDRKARGGTDGFALSPTRKPDFHNWPAAATLELGE